MKKRLFSLPLMIILGLSACSETEPLKQSNLHEMTNQVKNTLPTYKIHVMSENPPYIQLDEKGGTMGLEADLLQAIGKEQGFNVSIKTHPWKGLFDTLNTGSADLVCSGLFITPERAKKYDITQPYMQVNLGALVTEGSGIDNVEGLNNKIVMGRSGSNVFEKILKDEVLKGQKTTTKGFETTYLAVQALAQKQGDAVFAVETTLKDIQKRLPETFKTKFISYQQQKPIYVGCFARHGRTDNLIDKFDAGLKQLAQNGTLAKIMTKWTGQADSLPVVDKATLIH